MNSLPLKRPQAVVMVTLLAITGIFSILSAALSLWSSWTNNPLKSIGGLVPLVSLVLILRAWRSLDWELDGTWWGLAIIIAAVAMVHMRDRALLEVVLGRYWVVLPPPPLIAFAYSSGMVLLFGGARLYRTGFFPIALTWFVNPVPDVFSLYVDLPLQHASATVARGFAHAIGQTLSPDQLRLMFTPEFGMFIAPGCNGIRGAVTMGFIALVIGYLYRFTPRAITAVTACGVLLGYAFNLIRLCALVLYYIVALRFPWLQSRAEMGDYLIGAALFFVATIMLREVVRWFSPTGVLRFQQQPRHLSIHEDRVPRSFLWRWSALLFFLAYGSIDYARAILHPEEQVHTLADSKALGPFPKRVGGYTLEREWNEQTVTGSPIYYWAAYAPADDGPEVSIGISPVLGGHDILLCHLARGEKWEWHGELPLRTAGTTTGFSASFFDDGVTQYLEATTLCTADTCGQYSTPVKKIGLTYSALDTKTLLRQHPTRPIPILLRVENPDTKIPSDRARAELSQNLANFLREADLSALTSPYR